MRVELDNIEIAGCCGVDVYGDSYFYGNDAG